MKRISLSLPPPHVDATWYRARVLIEFARLYVRACMYVWLDFICVPVRCTRCRPVSLWVNWIGLCSVPISVPLQLIMAMCRGRMNYKMTVSLVHCSAIFSFSLCFPFHSWFILARSAHIDLWLSILCLLYHHSIYQCNIIWTRLLMWLIIEANIMATRWTWTQQ